MLSSLYTAEHLNGKTSILIVVDFSAIAVGLKVVPPSVSEDLRHIVRLHNQHDDQ